MTLVTVCHSAFTSFMGYSTCNKLHGYSFKSIPPFSFLLFFSSLFLFANETI